MWDDSTDSFSPQERKGKSSTTKYDFPETKKSNKSKKADQEIDDLFGDTPSGSEVNSPVADRSDKGYKPSSYGAPPPQQEQKKSYLSNFAASSGDFEDSILGELLGGIEANPGKSGASKKDRLPTTSDKSSAKLAPIDASQNDSPPKRSLSKHASSPSITSHRGASVPIQSQRSSSFRFATELPSSFMSSPSKLDQSYQEQELDRSLPEPTMNRTSRPHHNSFDMDVGALDSSSELPSTIAKPSAPARAVSTSATSFPSTSKDAGPMPGRVQRGESAPSTFTNSHRSVTAPAIAEKDKDNNDDENNNNSAGGFIPSFLDSNNRAGRRRRPLGDDSASNRPATTGTMDHTTTTTRLSKLDDLDSILGLGPSSTSANSAPKPILDPFAGAEKKALAAKASFKIDSDSSDDEAFRSSSRTQQQRRDPFGSFLTKPKTAVSITTAPLDVNNKANKSPLHQQPSHGSSAINLPVLTPNSSFKLSSPSTDFAPAPSSSRRLTRTSSSRDDGDEDELNHSGIFRTRSSELAAAAAKDSSASHNRNHTNSPLMMDREKKDHSQERPTSASSTTPSAVDATVTSSTSSTAGTGGIQLSRKTARGSIISPGKMEEESLHRTKSKDQETSSSSSGFGAALPASSSARTTRFSDDDQYFGSSRQDRPEQQQAAGHLAARLLSQSKQEKEGNEKVLLHELDRLRQKIDSLEQSAPSYHQRSISSGSNDERAQQQEQQLHHMRHEHNDAKRIISQLEYEINRLKDELNLQAAKHIDALKYQQDKHDSEIRTLQQQAQSAGEAIERRHAESLQALRKVHQDEISSWKERYKGAEVFESIAGQIRNTTGSMKQLEEQLQTRHQNLELIREGQMQAREKLLLDMEEKARERADLAEAEGYKLKGILSHMEHVVENLRSQGYEEKERLAAEHHRLRHLQDSLEAEKKVFQQRFHEENERLKARQQEVETDTMRWNQDKAVQMETLQTTRRKLEQEKSELQARLQAQKLNLENMEASLREEKKRLQCQRDELQQEKFAFEQRKVHTSHDIQEAEEVKKLLNSAAKKLHHEQEQVAITARKLEADREEFRLRLSELQRHREAVEQREHALRQGMAEMKTAAANLSTQETYINTVMKQLEQRKKDLDQLDRDVGNRRVTQATIFRENMQLGLVNNTNNQYHHQPQQQQQEEDNNVDKSMMSSMRGWDSAVMPPQPPPATATGLTGIGEGEENTAPSFSATEPVIDFYRHHRGGGSGPSGAKSWSENFQSQMRQAYVGNGLVDRSLPKEVRDAQKTLRESRTHLQRVSLSSLNTKMLLDSDAPFLRTLQQKREAYE